jgi:hypothetical protein
MEQSSNNKKKAIFEFGKRTLKTPIEPVESINTDEIEVVGKVEKVKVEKTTSPSKQEVPTPVSIMGSTGGAGMSTTIEEDDSKERITYYMKTKYITLVARASYWDRLTQAEIIESALEMYFKDKSYEPTPKEKK